MSGSPREWGSRSRVAWISVAVLACALIALTMATRPAAGATPTCKGGTIAKTVEVGIVKAIGCWTQATPNGQTVYTGAWENQDKGIDLNGFILTGPTGGGLQINAATRQVTSVKLSGSADDRAQINSNNFPTQGAINPLGGPLKLDFIAPEHSGLQLEDLHLGSNAVAGALAGLSPVGTIETPVRIEEGGTGSMDLTIALAGYFTLKGKPQSVTIALPTDSGNGTKFDGFELDIEEIDSFKVIEINNLVAKYSASQKSLSGAAGATFPFTVAGKVGFGVNFAFQSDKFFEVGADAHGLKIPIGAPPGGFITKIGGGFRLSWLDTGGWLPAITASTAADFGPEIPTPFGEIAPISADASLFAGYEGKELVFKISGNVSVFRIPVGDAYVFIHFNSGVEFGAGLGLGLPSFKNNSNDPFYIGARVDGWVAKGKFQLEGSGGIRLLGIGFSGRILVNDQSVGACWKVPFPFTDGIDGGAVYKYGDVVRTFGVGCGLDDYKEKFPQAASASASHPRQIRLRPDEVVLDVKGQGGAPRFTMRSADGQVLRAPTDRDSVIERSGRTPHAFFVNQGGAMTNVLLPHPKGLWTVTPYPGSPPITSLKAGREAPKEHVKAEVRGNGPVRTLVWNSKNRPHTRLMFTERLKGGQELPILRTGKAQGSHRFKVSTGSRYGKRAIRVVVIHGYGSTQSSVVDHYRVNRPKRLDAPANISAYRHNHDVYVKWSPVRGAHDYLVQVAMRQNGKLVSSYLDRLGPRHRMTVFKHHPGGGVAVAKVYALNSDDKPGRAGRQPFRTNPNVRGLRPAARLDVHSARLHDGKVSLMMRCPEEGHCRTEVRLLDGKRVVGRAHFQQTPDTFHLLRIKPKRGTGGDPLKVVVKLRRSSTRATARGAVTP
jgi:hypothetical protein